MVQQAAAYLNGRDPATLSSKELKYLVDLLGIPLGKVIEPDVVWAIKTILGPYAESKPE